MIDNFLLYSYIKLTRMLLVDFEKNPPKTPEFRYYDGRDSH